MVASVPAVGAAVTVTLVKVGVALVPIVISLPLRATLILVPSRNLTVSLDLTADAVSLFACNFHVWFCKFVTLVLVVNSCPPFTASFEPDAILPSATPVITLLPAFIPAVVTLGPPVIVKPVVSSLLLPAVMLSNFASFAKRISSPVAVVTVFTFSLLVAVSAPVKPPLMSRVCPKFRCTLVPLFPAKSKPALVRFVLTVSNCPLFTASDAAVAFATLVILSPPTSKPFAVLVKVVVFAPVPITACGVVIPVLLITVAPVVTLPAVPKLIASASLISSWLLPFATTPILLLVSVPVAPPLTFRSSPNLRVAFVPLSPTKPSDFVTSVFKLLRAVATLFAAVYVVPSVLVIV